MLLKLGAPERERESKSPRLNFLLKTFLSLVIFVLLPFVVNSSVYAASTTLTAIVNGYIDAKSPTIVNSGSTFFSIGQFGGTQTNRGLLLFDISSLGTDWTVNSATLNLTVSTNFLGTSHTINIYRLKRKWIQSPAGGSSYVNTNHASYNNYRQDLSSAWTTAGAGDTTNDRDATPIGSFNVTSATTGTVSITLDPTMVQGWIAGSYLNNGLLLQASDETDTTLIRWKSITDATPANRPQLVIDYTPVSHILTDNLISYWKMSEATGNNLVDSFSNGHTLIQHNSPTSVAGIIGNAQNYVTSSSQYHSNSDAPLKQGNNDWTWAGWVKLTDKLNFYTLVSNENNGIADNAGWSVFYHKQDVLDYFVFQIYGTGGSAIGSNPMSDIIGYNGGNPPTGSWIFVVARNDSVRHIAHLFINNNAPDRAGSHDGVEGDAALTYPGTMVAESTGDFTLGGAPGSGPSPNGYLNGGIDEVGFWNRWLSNSEILSLYNSGTGLSYPFGLVAPAAPSSLAQYKSDGTTAISSGGWTNQTSAVLKFSMSSTNSSDSLTPYVEIRPNATSFTNTMTNSGSGVAYSGSPVTGSVTVTGLTDGTIYHWQASVNNSIGLSSWTTKGSSPDFGVDTTAPALSSQTTFSGWYNSNQTSTFTYTDSGSGIASGTPVTCTISTEGSAQTCSVTPNVCDAAGNCNTTLVTSNGANIDKTAPTIPGTPTTTSLTTVNKPVWTWIASTDSGSGLAATPYSVQWCGNSSFTGCDTNTDTATTNTYTQTAALADGTWYFRVKATDAASNSSAYSSSGTDTINTVVTTTSTSSSSSNNSSSTSTACTDQAPGAKAPWLYGAITQDSGSVLLYFTEADNPVNKYVLEYGTKSGDYPYGVQDMGVNIRGQMTFLVKSLSPNTSYYFRVRGGNGCATGTWSNEISATTKGLVSFNQLEITQSQLETQPVTEIPSNTSCQTYTVKSGDSLWSIAEKLLGDGNKYKDIIDQNKDKYSSLANSNNISSGWELKINCGKQITTEETKKTAETSTQGGYDVKVKVVDTSKKPVEGATVTLHSNPQTTITDKNGVASFSNVEAGDHKVLIAYNNFEGEQSINLTGNVKEFDLNVTVQQKAIALSPLAYGIIGVMGLVIIGLIILLVKNKRKE